MSGSSRNRYSQWGLRDEPEFAPDSKQLWSGLTSADAARGNASKWSYLDGNEKLRPNWGFSSKESFAGDRGSSKDDLTIKDYIGSLDATVAWDRDRSYSAKISPGFKEWKHKRHGQSPKHNWGRSVRSRSRSRSPAHSFRWDSGVNDRYRMKLTQSCRAFRARKCRRGNNCHFLHHDNENYEDSGEKRHKKDGAPRYSAPHKNRNYSLRSGKSNEKRRCRMGPSCKYVHHGNCDGFSKGPVDESTRESETDRRVRENSFEQAGGHEPNLSGDTSCRFFAARKCHNGKYCRLSHDRSAFRSPQRRLRNDRWGSNPGGDQLLNRLKCSVSVSPSGRLGDDRWGSDENMVDANKMRNGPKWNDTAAISNSAKLDEGTYGNIDAPKSGFTAWPLLVDGAIV